MKSSKALFDSLSNTDSFHRVDSNHPLDLYCGYDHIGRYTLLLISSTPPERLTSSRVIDVCVCKRTKDEKWTISFSLINNEFKELYLLFCDDLILSSKNINDKTYGAKFICKRYISWQEMLSAIKSDALSRSQIKGLLGEMLFMSDFLMDIYGIDVCIKSWTGPDMADQDFIFYDTWYEVKAITTESDHVSISSIEQLDNSIEGTLAILALDRTSILDEHGITINGLFNKLINYIESDTIKTNFKTRLLKFGYYPRQEYDEYIYRLNGIRLYRVDNNFPCLRRSNLPNSVVNATWTLSLPAINAWIKE